MVVDFFHDQISTKECARREDRARDQAVRASDRASAPDLRDI